MRTECSRVGMGRHDRMLADLQHILGALVREMRDVHDDAELIALLNNADPEMRQSACVSLTNAIAQAVADIVRQTKATQTQSVEVAQIGEFRFQGRGTLQTDHNG